MLRSNLQRPDDNGHLERIQGRLQSQREFPLVERTVSHLDGQILKILEGSHLKQ